MQSDDRKLAFLDDPVGYERRAVVFYDVMGWKSKIEAAGNDRSKVTVLKNIVRLFNNLQSNCDQSGVRQTTFSDNVVISTGPSLPNIFTLLMRLSMTQLAAAFIGGFLIRGGVTVGDILHDDYVVLGPALNRAYELESTLADTPRIILDPKCPEFLGVDGLGSFIANEGGYFFLNPWTVDFTTVFWKLRSRTLGEIEGVGSPAEFLAVALGKVLMEMDKKVGERAKRQMTWLRDRLAGEVIKSRDRGV